MPGRVRKKFVDDRRSSMVSAPAEGPAFAVEVEEREATEPHWKDQLLMLLRAIASDAFERVSQRILREAGFLKV